MPLCTPPISDENLPLAATRAGVQTFHVRRGPLYARRIIEGILNDPA